MPRSAGTYTLPAGNPVVTNTTITSTWANTTLNDIAAELTNSVPRDGTAPPTANLPMGNFRLTGLGAATAATDAVQLQQVINGATNLVTGVGGTTTAYTGSVTGMTAYVTGQFFWFTPNATNTGAATLNINSLGAISIFNAGGSAVLANQLGGGTPYLLYYNGTHFRAVAGRVVLTGASTAALAGINLPHGTAPSSPNNGDLWTTSSGMLAQINGATRTIAFKEINNSFTASQTITAGTGGVLNLDPSGVTSGYTTTIAPDDNAVNFVTNSATRGFRFRPNNVLTVEVTGAGKLNTIASVSGNAGLNVPHGTAPSAPTNGDVWTTTAGLFARINGTTEQYARLTSPTFVTPALGTPSSGTLTNCTDLPISTGVSGLGAGIATFLATPSSANLAAAVTGETGSGALVFATSPTLVTPVLGTPTSGTLTNCTGLPIVGGTTGTLSVARGGTGTTTSTGTGNTVLSASPTFTGTVNAAAISASGAVTADSINVRSTTSVTGFVTGSRTYDAPSIPIRNTDTFDITVSGASVGNPVAIGHNGFTLNTGQICIKAYVSASNTVTVSLVNTSDTGPVDLGSITYTAIVFNY